MNARLNRMMLCLLLGAAAFAVQAQQAPGAQSHEGPTLVIKQKAVENHAGERMPRESLGTTYGRADAGESDASKAKPTKADAAREVGGGDAMPGDSAASDQRRIEPMKQKKWLPSNFKSSRSAHDGVTDATEGDGAAAEAPAGATARGIEKKDIRRGMVIAKPGSITPHTRESDPADSTPEPGAQRDAQNVLKTKHDTVKNSISNIR